MRITSWNVNGILTIQQFKPWVDLPDVEAYLNYLETDMACFQETKITRKSALEVKEKARAKEICIVNGFHSFFDFHPTRGYSGTVTYIRKSLCCPVKSETGLTGSLLPLQVRSNSRHSIGSYPERCEEEMDEVMFKSLDAEGRSVITDCGMFVLFNLYCPNLTNEERSDYKMNFYLCLEERIRNLLAAGREVIVVGDLNIIRGAIDHPEPSEAMRAAKEAGLSSFTETSPSRRWLNSMLRPVGPLHDVGREFHPSRAKMYTCWDTLKNTRPQNYGSRLDYTLTSPGIREWVRSANVQETLMGSDHCPVYIDLYDERQIDGKLVKLKDLLSGGPDKLKAPVPPLATSNWPEYRGNQKTIKDLFAKASLQNSAFAEASSSNIAAIAAESEGEKAALLSKASFSSSSDLLSKSESIGLSRAASSRSSSSQSGGGSSSLKRSASSSTSPSKEDTKKKKPKKAGQQKLKSYFTKEKPSETEVKEVVETLTDSSFNTGSSSNSFHQDSTSTSQQTIPEDVLAALLDLPDSDRSFLTTSPSKEDKEKVSAQWNNLFQKPTPPKCERHKEDATYWTVNKPGPNRGRGFWLCSRPVGEGYEKEGRKNSSTEYRCNYFCWESERPKNKSSKPGSSSSKS